MEENTVNFNEQPILKISPKFDFLYELGMPTGKKIKSSILLILIFSVGLIIFLFNKNRADLSNFNGINFESIILTVIILALIASIVKLIIHIVMKKMQYANITYAFYNDHMYYEDSFLNQHRKNIKYSNIKEVEIRRTIWDRILGFGIIVIYTNAENEYSNGLVIYGIRQPQQYYETIESLVHNKKQEKIEENIVEKTIENDDEKAKEEPKNQISEDYLKMEEEAKEQTHEEFIDSLKNINKQD